MGAWGIGNFDNDTACDWAYELEESSDLSVIQRSIDAVFDDDYIDGDIGSEALAAIDTLARLMGRFGVKNSYTETVDRWVSKNKLESSKDLIEKSNKALKAILGKTSELADLWSDSDEFENWKSEVKLLKSRLNS
ncbi:MAG: DUF4259 domain-containing protein [Deltaproteobacteria bacterium]|nr:DUF4259 domain-containing protein [Deltaproteobacteria bacterium]